MHRSLTQKTTGAHRAPAGKPWWRSRPAIGLAVVLTVVGASAESCSGEPTAQQQETGRQQSSYNTLSKQQPAHVMNYSPTRDQINFWIDTWSKPNKLSYVYLQNANGDITGYYIFKGLPVSYCTSLTPTYQLRDESSAGELMVPAPSVDGVFYSGGECNTYYGKDATTNAYVEYTAGLGINVLLYDQPLPKQKAPDAKALGPTSVEDVKK